MKKLFYSVIAVLSFAFGFWSAALPARAYHLCDPVASRVSATLEGRVATFKNRSAYCVRVGAVVYKLASAGSEDRTFYYAKEAGLPGSSTYSFSIPTPECSAYVIDVIVGKPLRDFDASNGYGNRLLLEETGSNFDQSCESSYRTVAYAGPVRSASPPLPKSTTPLPSPSASAPLPTPEVLGAQTSPTSTNPLLLETGASMRILLMLLVVSVFSGVVWLAVRNRQRIVIRHEHP